MLFAYCVIVGHIVAIAGSAYWALDPDPGWYEKKRLYLVPGALILMAMVHFRYSTSAAVRRLVRTMERESEERTRRRERLLIAVLAVSLCMPLAIAMLLHRLSVL